MGRGDMISKKQKTKTKRRNKKSTMLVPICGETD